MAVIQRQNWGRLGAYAGTIVGTAALGSALLADPFRPPISPVMLVGRASVGSGTTVMSRLPGTTVASAAGMHYPGVLVEPVQTVGLIFTAAGNGVAGYNGDGIPATSASVNGPNGFAIDEAGNVYIAELDGQRIRKIDAATGLISTVAGNGVFAYNGDGIPAVNASLRWPRDVAVDRAGNLYIADSWTSRIRKVDAATGLISTVAGKSGGWGYNGDGILAVNAWLRDPFSVAVDKAGNLYIADYENDRIRKVDAATGLISTVAGTGTFGFSGDGGPATSAQLYYPVRVRLDNDDNLYITDSSNHRIRRVDAATGIISTVAGGRANGGTLDGGPATTSANLNFPWGTAIDINGDLYIADRVNHRVRRVDAATGVISTAAGIGDAPYNGDGIPATAATLHDPFDVALDHAGNLYVADFYSQRVRKIVITDVRDTTPPVIANVPTDIQIEATSSTGALTAWEAPTANDDRDGSIPVTCAPASGSMFPLGATPVTCTAVDAAGNSGSAIFTVTIIDTTPPVISSHVDITLEATQFGGAVVAYQVPTASDVVDGAVQVACQPAVNSLFGLGVTTIVCDATDAHGNMAGTRFFVTVRDTTPPVLSGLPTAVLVEATGPNGARATWVAPTATDIADGPVPVICTSASGAVYPLGITNVTCTAIDASGSQASGAFTITVRDTTPPVVTTSGNVTTPATGATGATATFTSSAADTVDVTDPVTCAPASGSTFPVGTTMVTCSATDAHGNIGTATLTVTVTDEPPVVTVPSNITMEATAANGALVTFSTSATDVVDGSDPVTCAPSSGSTFGIGTTTVTCTAIDHARQSSNASFTVTVVDTTAPSLSGMPANLTREATSNAGAAVTFTAPTATDLVDGSVAVACAPASGSLFALGATPVTCTATDAAGNSSSAFFTVTVIDTTPPVIASHADITLEAMQFGGAVVAYQIPTASDIVDGAVPVVCQPALSTLFGLGVTRVICNSTDSHGNGRSSSFTVTVIDTTPPVIASLPNNQVLEASSAGGAVATWVAPAATDIADGPVPVTCTSASGSTYPLGVTNVTCTATDASGNQASGAFTITVRDTTPPDVPSPTATPGVLWPPNHQMVAVTLSVTPRDLVDAMPVCKVTKITSSEPENDLENGDIAPDWTITGPLAVMLRAERSGTGPGRTYTLTVACSDASGNTALATSTVRVPKSQVK